MNVPVKLRNRRSYLLLQSIQDSKVCMVSDHHFCIDDELHPLALFNTLLEEGVIVGGIGDTYTLSLKGRRMCAYLRKIYDKTQPTFDFGYLDD